ncbi:hypothetical protein [Microbacterium lacticum]
MPEAYALRRGDRAQQPGEQSRRLAQAAHRSSPARPGLLAETRRPEQLWGEAAVDPEIRDLVHGVFLELRGAVIDAIAEWAAANADKVEGDPHAWAARIGPIVLSTAPGFILQTALMPDFDAAGYLAALPAALPHRGTEAPRHRGTEALRH